MSEPIYVVLEYEYEDTIIVGLFFDLAKADGFADAYAERTKCGRMNVVVEQMEVTE